MKIALLYKAIPMKPGACTPPRRAALSDFGVSTPCRREGPGLFRRPGLSGSRGTLQPKNISEVPLQLP
jgi:hypothetical protein